MGSCEQDHHSSCSCYFGLCRKCGGRMIETKFWKRTLVQSWVPALPAMSTTIDGGAERRHYNP